MFNFITTIYYKLLVLTFYYLGDLCSRVDSEFFCELYQKYINLSFDYDKKINFWFWKYPNE